MYWSTTLSWPICFDISSKFMHHQLFHRVNVRLKFSHLCSVLCLFPTFKIIILIWMSAIFHSINVQLNFVWNKSANYTLNHIPMVDDAWNDWYIQAGKRENLSLTCKHMFDDVMMMLFVTQWRLYGNLILNFCLHHKYVCVWGGACCHHFRCTSPLISTFFWHKWDNAFCLMQEMLKWG
jgi:hypothetical protein